MLKNIGFYSVFATFRKNENHNSSKTLDFTVFSQKKTQKSEKTIGFTVKNFKKEQKPL